MILVVGPPPPPLPPPLKAPNPNNHQANQLNNRISQQSRHSPIENADAPDSDSGFEVLEEPTLRPSELVKGNHNRTMSSISGELFQFSLLWTNWEVSWKLSVLLHSMEAVEKSKVVYVYRSETPNQVQLI